MPQASNNREPMKELNDNEELQKGAPTLFGLPKYDPFVVEAGFFERFPHEVQTMAFKSKAAPLSIWLKRAAVALPALAVVLFAVHSLRDPKVSLASDPVAEETMLATASDPFDTRSILAGIPEEEWPAFDAVTVQLTPNEALAYVDRHDIDLTEYLDLQ